MTVADPPAGPELSVVFMAYDEARGLAPSVHLACEVLDALGVSSEIIVVDDGSTDDTPNVARELATADRRIRVVTHSPNRGLGAVYRTGFVEARGEWITFFPADGELPATNLRLLWEKRAGMDLVLGTVDESALPPMGRVLGTMERQLLKVLFGPFPRFQGVFLVRSAWLRSVSLTSQGRGWTIVMEMILRAHRGRARLAWAKTEMAPRLGGISKARTLRNIAANLRQVAALRLALWRE